MDPISEGGGDHQTSNPKLGKDESVDSGRSKKTSAFYFAGGPLSGRVNYQSITKAKIRKSKSDHGGTNVGLETAKLYRDSEAGSRSSVPVSSTSSDGGSKSTRNTNIGQSHSFNFHHNRQSKKSAVGMGLANINQQLLSATMFGVVLGGDSKASQQVSAKIVIFVIYGLFRD